MRARKFDEELLKIVACPSCKKSLKMIKNELICIKCSKKYAINQGIPLLILKNQ